MPADIPIEALFAPFFVLSVIIEWWAVKSGHAKGRYETADAVTSMTMGLGNAIIGTLTGVAALWIMMLVWPYRVMTVPTTWWSFAIVFVLYDFVYYWKHRFAHRVRWFWMEHVTHHSSKHYNLTTALRQPWYGPFTGLIIVGWSLVLLGFHPALIGIAGGINLVYQFWIHTEAIDKCPRWFEAIFNTPSHHRVHHATNTRYLDANYAGVFITWDKMFGSFIPEREEDKPDYGIVKPLNSYNPVTVAFHEFAALVRDCVSDGFRPLTWVKRAINAPGWSPDGQHNRTEEIRARWQAERETEKSSV
jgi:sterol desaturase/sphingolipid hydroxylase (fatty acid hydroxylase superfamily)